MIIAIVTRLQMRYVEVTSSFGKTSLRQRNLLVPCAFSHAARSIGPDTERRMEEVSRKKRAGRMPLGNKRRRASERGRGEGGRRDREKGKVHSRGSHYFRSLDSREDTRRNVICGRCSVSPKHIDLHLSKFRISKRNSVRTHALSLVWKKIYRYDT